MIPISTRVNPIQRTWLDCILQILINGLDLLVRRRVKNDDNSSDQADSATETPQNSKRFLEEVRTKYGTDENTESTKRCDENGGSECVCSEIADLAKSHYYASLVLKPR